MTNEPASATISAVRERTRSAHQRLERRLQLTHAPSRAGYAAYLGLMYGVVRTVEQLVAGSRESLFRLPDAPERLHKSAALGQDLTELGVIVSALPAWPAPEPRDLADLFGTWYVLEGSTLGGQVLARQLEAELGTLPTRYLRCYGADTGAKWRTFLAALETFAEPAERLRLARAAEQTFESIEAWFEQGGLLAEVGRG